MSQAHVESFRHVLALRVTYTAELGWQLHVPIAGMPQVYRALTANRHNADLVHVGSTALNSMRMEKAYRSGHEITNEVTLAEADVLRFARSGGFQGSEVSTAPASRWVPTYLKLDEPGQGEDQVEPPGAQSVWHQGKPVEQISSCGYGYAA